jgi:hypothetical protein
MRTNLSRFTVAFSDFAWDSVDLTDPATATPSSQGPPMFPRAWQVGRYLVSYAENFHITSRILLNHKVTNVERVEASDSWVVTFVDTVEDEDYIRLFDYLVVSTGFFDRPTHSFGSSPSGLWRSYQHSSAFRTLANLTDKAGKIMVIGGGISGAEAAAEAAFQISNAKHCPSADTNTHAESRVYHVFDRPIYCLPRHIPQTPTITAAATNPTPTFLPLDLVLYNLARRPKGNITAAISTMPPENAKKAHAFIQASIGGQHQSTGPTRRGAPVDCQVYCDTPAYTGITDTYEEFVRSGLIVQVQGRVASVEAIDHSGFAVTTGPGRLTSPSHEVCLWVKESKAY